MDDNPNNRDEVSNQEEAQLFLRRLGLTVDEGNVRVVVQTLQGKTDKSKYDLWATGKYRDERERRPVCGRGTADKIHRLYREGSLQQYLAYLDTLKRGNLETSDNHADLERDASDELDSENPPAQALEIKLETNSEGLILRSHESASLLEPITVFMSVCNRGKEVVRYLQMHVWLPRHYTFWNPEKTNLDRWGCEGPGILPQQFQFFNGDLKFERYVLRLSPDSGFFLMPSLQPFDLPPLEIIRRPAVGMVPLPWQLEATGLPPASGMLLLWCDSEGRFHSESLGSEVHVEELEEKIEQFSFANNITDLPESDPIPDC